MEEIAITSEIVSELCGYIRIGASFNTAALACGLSEDQILEVLQNLENLSDEFYKEFLHDLKKAQSQFEVIQLMKVSAEGGAKGAQWLLARAESGKYKKLLPKKDKTEDVWGLLNSDE